MIGALVAGIGGLLGLGASAAGAAASTVGSLAVGAGGLGVSAASGLVSGIGGLASGAGSLLFGGPAAGTTVGQQMAAIAQPAYYETAGAGILGGVASAASKTVGFLGELAPSAAGIYSVIKPPEKAVVIPPGTRAPMPAVSAPSIAKSPLPIFSRQPQVMTVGAAAEPKKMDYTLYIVLAVVVLFLLRRK